jgi:hypothetical protein
MQLTLRILQSPSPHAAVWEQLDEAQRALVLAVMARLIAQAAQTKLDVEDEDNE